MGEEVKSSEESAVTCQLIMQDDVLNCSLGADQSRSSSRFEQVTIIRKTRGFIAA